ncbi:LuxR C-terminal-related transcriptional regulator [Roseiconus lacunae]|uniref:LuxR C-terminal-related transcriptional regulator n=1 Tax=Roseiconus lacunae TaxID=2605694 RepID=A0ABT7PHM1_9BACT|nr:LuxR C-terminal-related transcriptional regulator [Roseiconus lacunae]MDM4016002.1 LuxR C-terminal-related transcriptional regulator [Roseiconus lacunae]
MVYSTAAPDQPRLTDFVAPHAFISQDLSGNITEVSHSITEVLGYSPETLVGRPINTIFSPDCRANDYFRFASDRRPTHLLLSLLSSSDESRVFSVYRNRSIGSGQDDRYHNLLSDVTDEVRQYQTLKSRLETLQSIQRGLSDQEHQVAERIVNGMLNREIAEELQVSERTVDRRRASVMNHYGVDSTAELVCQLSELSHLKTFLQIAGQSTWRTAVNVNELAARPLSRSA